jgi:hypothetical protein
MSSACLLRLLRMACLFPTNCSLQQSFLHYGYLDKGDPARGVQLSLCCLLHRLNV